MSLDYEGQDFLKVGTFRSLFDHEVYRIDINTEKQLLFVGCDDGKIFLFKWRISGSSSIFFEPYMEIHKHFAYIWYSTFSPDGNFLYSGDDSGKIIKWSVEESKEIHEFKEHSDTRCLLTYKNYFISSSENKNLIIWDLKTNEKLHSFQFGVYTKLYIVDDDLVILKQDGEVMIMNMNNFEIVLTLKMSKKTKALWSFLEMKNGDYLIGNDEGNIYQFNRNSNETPKIKYKNSIGKRISHLMYFRGEIVSVSMSKELTFHDPISLEALRSYKTESSTTTLVNISNKFFLTCGISSKEIKVWHLKENSKMSEMLKKKKILDISFLFQ
jgi:WD40 repeat protein